MEEHASMTRSILLAVPAQLNCLECKQLCPCGLLLLFTDEAHLQSNSSSNFLCPPALGLGLLSTRSGA